MPTTISVTEASRRFSDLVNRVFYRRESAILVKGGKPVAKIVPLERTAKTGREVVAGWAGASPTDRAEAEAWATEIEEGRKNLPASLDPWA